LGRVDLGMFAVHKVSITGGRVDPPVRRG
jgi:hypothetical protein